MKLPFSLPTADKIADQSEQQNQERKYKQHIAEGDGAQKWAPEHVHGSFIKLHGLVHIFLVHSDQVTLYKIGPGAAFIRNLVFEKAGFEIISRGFVVKIEHGKTALKSVQLKVVVPKFGFAIAQFIHDFLFSGFAVLLRS